jgi:glycosyltransferase involved in cell wall biosynthesis
MRLGFHYHVPAVLINNQIYMPGYFGRFVDSLAKKFEYLVCFLHTPMQCEEKLMDYSLQSTNVILVNIGPHSSIPQRTLHIPSVLRKIRLWRDQLDLMLIRGPSPLLPEVAKACNPIPTALLLVGDYLAGIEGLPQPGWRKEVIRVWSRLNARRQLDVAKRSLTFVNSHLLYKQLQGKVPNLVETRTTTLTEDDFYEREDTCQTNPVHLLYTGRMDRSKGLQEIVEATAILIEQGCDLVFDLVGMEEKGDPVLEELKERAKFLGISEKICYHGYQTLGPKLFSFYNKADIYIIASQSSFEGFPRTIWEAMAHSLPVIATRVGSIPDYIEGAAELIEPKNVNSIVNAVLKLIHNPSRRRFLIKMGRTIAQENTLERRAQDMKIAIDEYFRNRTQYEKNKPN